MMKEKNTNKCYKNKKKKQKISKNCKKKIFQITKNIKTKNK